MSGRVLIVGQGLAGTALGLELEEAGVDFVIVSAGHAEAASRVAAGLVNPVTGRRWVKSARVDELLPFARDRYAQWSGTLGVELWHPLRLTRVWRDAAERTAVEAKIARGELAPYVAAVDARGVELAGAAWVDLPALLAAAEARWCAQGRWRAARMVADELAERGEGAEKARSGAASVSRWSCCVSGSARWGASCSPACRLQRPRERCLRCGAARWRRTPRSAGACG